MYMHKKHTWACTLTHTGPTQYTNTHNPHENLGIHTRTHTHTHTHAHTHRHTHTHAHSFPLNPLQQTLPFFFSTFLLFFLSRCHKTTSLSHIRTHTVCLSHITSHAVTSRHITPHHATRTPVPLTSFIVLVVGAGGLHGDAAAGTPPAGLALAVPAVLSHGALPVPVTQVRTTICGCLCVCVCVQ